MGPIIFKLIEVNDSPPFAQVARDFGGPRKQRKVSLATHKGCKNHGSPLISINTACDQVEFRGIYLTGFRNCASRSQTGAFQSRQSTD
nr:hypothetical protein [Tanacetum cinerariifolium]